MSHHLPHFTLSRPFSRHTWTYEWSAGGWTTLSTYSTTRTHKFKSFCGFVWVLPSVYSLTHSLSNEVAGERLLSSMLWLMRIFVVWWWEYGESVSTPVNLSYYSPQSSHNNINNGVVLVHLISLFSDGLCDSFGSGCCCCGACSVGSTKYTAHE